MEERNSPIILNELNGKPSENQGRNLDVSVIMPIRNEANFIERSLGTVLDQDFPVDRLEIILADGISDDGTREIIQKIIDSRKKGGHRVPDILLVDNPGKIVPTGMNAAIHLARGRFIVRVDGHTVLASDYVSQCVRLLETTDAANVGGPMRAVGEGYVAEAIALGTSTPFGIGNSAFHYSQEQKYVDTVYMGAFRKEALIQVGMFDERFVRHQDYELNYRIRENGGKVLLSPGIFSKYYVRSGLRKLWKQYYQYGCWKGKIMKYHPSSIKWRHTIPPLFVLALVGGILGSFFLPEVRMLLILLLGLYVSFLLVASIATAIRLGKPKYLPVLPFVFACLHLSYGIGVWVGLFSPRITERKHAGSLVNA